MNHIFFLIFLLLLYSVTIKLTSVVYGLVFLVTGSRKLALGILTLILLPGTIVHEMSHFLVATIFRVRTGKMTVFPETLEKGRIRAGKLEIENCDPFRKTIIGIAPMIIGLTLIYFIGHFFFPDFQLITHLPAMLAQALQAGNPQPITILGFYFLLTVSSTMFSSPKDLESLFIVVPILSVFLLIFYLLGLRISMTGNLLVRLEMFTGKLNFFLIITIVTDFIVLLLNQLGITFFEKILGRKLVEKII